MQVGDKYSHWTIVELLPMSKALASCSCGGVFEVARGNLRSGASTKCRKCGNVAAKAAATIANTTHGYGSPNNPTPTYRTWGSMKSRCDNPNQGRRDRYKSQGITYCERWAKFENFLEDMGERPDGTSLDRKDNSKGYFPENCRWATSKQQNRNTSKTVYVELDGVKMPLGDAAEMLEVPQSKLYYRVRRYGASDAISFFRTKVGETPCLT